MAAHALPDPETLRKLLHYDPETGSLHWLTRTPDMFSPFCLNGPEVACETWNAENAGQLAINSVNERGYFTGTLLGRSVRAHRVAWAIYHGEWPSDQIDHIDGNGFNNRIDNLRLANPAQNGRNRSRQANNTSGFKGVWWHQRDQVWAAKIIVDGKSIWLGSFQTAEAAHAAYSDAALRYHGEFAKAS